MEQNKVSIFIGRPIDEVFSYSLESNNVPKWIEGIRVEIPSERPVRQGTILRNTGFDENARWNEYEVIEINPPTTFTLRLLGSDYYCKYSFKEVAGGTKFEYLEWSESGLSDRFQMEPLKRLKALIESDQ